METSNSRHLGQCKLESGQVIENCRIGYRTFGNLIRHAIMLC